MEFKTRENTERNVAFGTLEAGKYFKHAKYRGVPCVMIKIGLGLGFAVTVVNGPLALIVNGIDSGESVIEMTIETL